MLEQSPAQNHELVIIGHLAFNEDHTPTGTQVSIGGAAYYCAAGAAVAPEKVGVVATVGPEFDLEALRQLGVDVQGITTVETGHTAHFVITQLPNGSRTFEADWGVAAISNIARLPASYMFVRHIHLATAPPAQQLAWIHQCRTLPNHPTISVDTFEHFVRESPQETRQALELADLVFINEEEASLLGIASNTDLHRPYILKRGHNGARYIDGRTVIDVPALDVVAVDTTGAGDVLAGAFLALKTQGAPNDQALLGAVGVATASVKNFGVDHSEMSEARDAVRARQTSLRRIHREKGQ